MTNISDILGESIREAQEKVYNDIYSKGYAAGCKRTVELYREKDHYIDQIVSNLVDNHGYDIGSVIVKEILAMKGEIVVSGECKEVLEC